MNIALRKHHLKRFYNITIEEYENLIEAQKNCCALCNKKLKKPYGVDHDHETKYVRGVLHDRCNRLLACAEENPVMLANAFKYLLIHKKSLKISKSGLALIKDVLNSYVTQNA